MVNQTTQLATDTQAIAEYLKQVCKKYYGLNEENIRSVLLIQEIHLCYATNDNQSAVTGIIENRQQILQLLLVDITAATLLIWWNYAKKNYQHILSTRAEKIISSIKIFFIATGEQKQEYLTYDFLPDKTPVKILITSGASCPDAIVEAVIEKLVGFYNAKNRLQELFDYFQ